VLTSIAIGASGLHDAGDGALCAELAVALCAELAPFGSDLGGGVDWHAETTATTMHEHSRVPIIIEAHTTRDARSFAHPIPDISLLT
jgi:thiazole synthase ThiGH ThiG subunit